MFVSAKTMYLCSRTLGELLRMHSGCFCLLQKQQCLVLERTGFGIFCRNEMSKMQKNWRSQHPLPFFQCIQSSLNMCVMIKTYETAHSHSLPLSKKISDQEGSDAECFGSFASERDQQQRIPSAEDLL